MTANFSADHHPIFFLSAPWRKCARSSGWTERALSPRPRGYHAAHGPIVLAQRAGLRTGLLSGRSSPTVARRAAELEMSVVRQGVRDKRAALGEILAASGLTAAEVAYIGDDVNDLPVLCELGLSAAPADAPLEVRAQCFMVTEAGGGCGCLREFVEAILRARGDWERVLGGLGVASL